MAEQEPTQQSEGAAPASVPQSVKAALERDGEGWRVRVPLGQENVSVEKRTFVREEIQVVRRTTEEVAKISETVRREELTLEKTGDLHVQEPPR
jgi:uncharacterized protein (TIGR02271 family)